MLVPLPCSTEQQDNDFSTMRSKTHTLGVYILHRCLGKAYVGCRSVAKQDFLPDPLGCCWIHQIFLG